MQSLDRILEGHFKQRWWQAYRGLSNVYLSGNFMEDYLTIRESYNKPCYGLDISSPAIEIFNLILDDPSRFSCEKFFNYNLTNSTSGGSHYYDRLAVLPTHMSNSKYLRTSNCIENCYLTLTDKVTEESFTFSEDCLLINQDAFTKTEVEIFQLIFRQWCKTSLKTSEGLERERLTEIYCKEK